MQLNEYGYWVKVMVVEYYGVIGYQFIPIFDLLENLSIIQNNLTKNEKISCIRIIHNQKAIPNYHTSELDHTLLQFNQIYNTNVYVL